MSPITSSVSVTRRACAWRWRRGGLGGVELHAFITLALRDECSCPSSHSCTTCKRAPWCPLHSHRTPAGTQTVRTLWKENTSREIWGYRSGFARDSSIWDVPSSRIALPSRHSHCIPSKRLKLHTRSHSVTSLKICIIRKHIAPPPPPPRSCPFHTKHQCGFFSNCFKKKI